MSIALPCSLDAGENAGNVCAVYVDNAGKVQWLINSVYDSAAKILRFATNHFSTYGVGYKTDAPSYTDISTHWAKDNILFAVNRGLVSGGTATTFAANEAVTRGALAVALGKLSGVDTSSYNKSSFRDVKDSAANMGHLEWANANKIISGKGGKFMPDEAVTREELAVILQSYVKAMGFTGKKAVLPKVYQEKAFTDNSKISSSAKANVTKGEFSAILRRFVELRISVDAAQGWSVNDSGKWMYYENGALITGKKTIDGTRYTFDRNGEMINNKGKVS